MYLSLKILLATTLLSACSMAPAVSSTIAPEATAAQDTARVATVLQGLRPRFEIEGRPPVRWTIEERMAHYGVPGVSIAVIENGNVAWVRGVGALEAGSSDPVTPATLFQAGSISKPVTATAMLRLVELGTLDLDTDVNHYLTSWQVPENPFTAEQKVTLRRIASHSAGLSVHGFRGYSTAEPLPTMTQVLEGTAPANNAPVVADAVPGATERYSGGGYTVMQQLLVDVTGDPFPALIRRLVLDPAGMSQSTYAQPLPASLAGGAARGHDAEGETVPGGWNVMPELAAAGLWTTATDLANWALAIADAHAGRSSTLLSKDMAEQMLTPQLGGFGLGPQVMGSGADFRFGHGGANVGFRAHVRMLPGSGAGVAIMTNGENGGALAEEIIRALAVESGWPTYAPERITPVALNDAAAAGLVGPYTLNVGPGRPVEVQLEDGRLMLHGPFGLVQELVPESDTQFVTPEEEWRVAFDRDAAGRATAIRVFHDASGDPIGGVPTPEEGGQAAPALPSLAAAEAARYEGSYVLQVGSQTRDLRVYQEEGQLMADLQGEGTSRLLYQGDRTFSAEVAPAFRFVFPGGDGPAMSVTLHANGRVIEGQRKP